MLFQSKDGFYVDIDLNNIEIVLRQQTMEYAAQNNNRISYELFEKLNADKRFKGPIHVNNLKCIHKRLVDTDNIEEELAEKQARDKQKRLADEQKRRADEAEQLTSSLKNIKKMVESILNDEPSPVPAEPVLPTVQIHLPKTEVSPSIGSPVPKPQPPIVITYQPKGSTQSPLPTQSAQTAQPRQEDPSKFYNQHQNKPIPRPQAPSQSAPQTVDYNNYQWIQFHLPKNNTYTRPVLVSRHQTERQLQRLAQMEMQIEMQRQFYTAMHAHRHHVRQAHSTQTYNRHQPKKP